MARLLAAPLHRRCPVLLLAWSAFSTHLSFSGQEPTSHGARAPDDLDRRMDALVPDLLARHAVPGAQLAVIDEGALAFSRSYGVRDRESGAPVTDDTRFNIGSVSKVLTAWAVMALLEESGGPRARLPGGSLAHAL